MSKRVSLFLVPALALVACGGGDDDAGGASGDDWCAQALRIEASSERYDDAFEEGGATLSEALDEFTSLLDDAKGSAPSEISDAVDTAADGIGRFNELLSEADYDIFALDESVFDELDAMGEEMDAATDQIEAYNARECGIPADSDESADDALPADDGAADEIAEDPALTPDDDVTDETADDTTDDVTFSGDATSDWCVAAQQVEDADDELDSLDFTDPAAVEAAFNEMIDQLEYAEQFAPPEIEMDVAVSYENFLLLREALVEVDYDFLNADLSVLEDSDEVMQAATDNIEAYNEQVCGIPADDDGATDDGGEDDNGFDPGAGTVLEQVVAELVETGFTQAEAECIIDKIDFTDPDLGDDPSAMIAVFDECGIDLARLVELGS